MLSHVPPPGTLFLDHVSHFVADLEEAAHALRALGLAVTPRSDPRTQDGPAGTSNVCVMLEHGYLEFLAATAETPNAARLRASMQRYPGVHLCCFGTPDADGEHRRLEAHGFSPSPVVDLQREIEWERKAGTARFKVARPGPGTMPEGHIQFVEHLTPDLLWNADHVNRGVRLACAFVVADDPLETAARWAHFAALLPQPAGDYVHLATARGHVLVGAPDAWSALLGTRPVAPGLAGYALECRKPREIASRCEHAGASVCPIRDELFAVHLPAALGGAWVVGDAASLGLPRA